jgi:hypothetical protein
MPEFSPSGPAVISNVLWFSSLILALSCAFLATFVQQWSRHFLHRTTVARTSIARANMFSCLYFGIKDLGMHTIVDVIPFLLHLSLFMFFGGLVAFFEPINPTFKWLAFGVLTVTVILYLALTIMPLVRLDSPYQTPLSPVIWRTWNKFRPLLRQAGLLAKYSRTFLQSLIASSKASPTNTDTLCLPTYHSHHSHRSTSLSGAVVAASSRNRVGRESRCIQSTLRSLDSDKEVLLFAQALTNGVCSSHNTWDNFDIQYNTHLLRPILETKDPQANILSRITRILSSYDKMWFPIELVDLSADILPSFVWSIAYMLNHRPWEFDAALSAQGSWFDPELFTLFDETYVSQFRISSPTVMVWFNILLHQEHMLGRPSAPHYLNHDVLYTEKFKDDLIPHFVRYLESAAMNNSKEFDETMRLLTPPLKGGGSKWTTSFPYSLIGCPISL